MAVVLSYAFILKGNQLKYNNYDLTKLYNLLDLIRKERHPSPPSYYSRQDRYIIIAAQNPSLSIRAIPSITHETQGGIGRPETSRAFGIVIIDHITKWLVMVFSPGV